MSLLEIKKRYTELATTGCCLSCGGAANYADAQPNEVCVDLGSGRGTDAIRLAEKVGIGGFVYGIDIADGMIEKAVNTAKNLDINNVKFIQSPIENIKLESEVADLLISNCTINHASDKQAVWNEIFRILKKGGRFVVSDIYTRTPVPDKYKNDAEAVAECWAGSVTRDEYLHHLDKAGFPTIAILEESAPYIKGEIMVVSWTITGEKPLGECNWCNQV